MIGGAFDGFAGGCVVLLGLAGLFGVFVGVFVLDGADREPEQV